VLIRNRLMTASDHLDACRNFLPAFFPDHMTEASIEQNLSSFLSEVKQRDQRIGDVQIICQLQRTQF